MAGQAVAWAYVGMQVGGYRYGLGQEPLSSSFITLTLRRQPHPIVYYSNAKAT